MNLKLYSICDSPPATAVRMALKYLDIDAEVIEVNFNKAEHLNEDFVKRSPQGEIPVLDDDGFILSESVAILQYLADKYRKDDTFYPEDPQKRAVVNHRLAFHLTTFYKAITDYIILPCCYDYPATELNLTKLKHALKLLDTFLTRQGTTYVAGENLTIADLSFVMGFVCLEVIGMDLSDYPKASAWYSNFKVSQGPLWEIAKGAMEELKAFAANPPDFSSINHPIHPTKGSKGN